MYTHDAISPFVAKLLQYYAPIDTTSNNRERLSSYFDQLNGKTDIEGTHS